MINDDFNQKKKQQTSKLILRYWICYFDKLKHFVDFGDVKFVSIHSIGSTKFMFHTLIIHTSTLSSMCSNIYIGSQQFFYLHFSERGNKNDLPQFVIFFADNKNEKKIPVTESALEDTGFVEISQHVLAVQ